MSPAARPLFHITTAEEAASAAGAGSYAPGAFAAEGFIHCSYLEQVCPVANRRFTGTAGLVLMEIEPGRLDCDVVEENLEGGAEQFPHIYGRLPMAAVVRVHLFPCGRDGRFELPPSVHRSE
jgi:uncharacterized protein (DUF952 family)